MLIKLFLKNYKAFNEGVELNLLADLRTKKFTSNIINHPLANVIKSAAIYGPNNTGKTCIINAIRDFKAVLLNQSIKLQSNFFSSSSIVKIGAEFIYLNKRYTYYFKYDTEKNVFEEESFCEIIVDQYGNLSTKELFFRSISSKKVRSIDVELEKVINLASKDNVLIHTLETSEFPLLDNAKSVLKGFAENINIVSTQSMQPYTTIEILKNPETPQAKQIVELIKNADLYIDDFKYEEKFAKGVKIEIDDDNEKEKGLQKAEQLVEVLKLTSIHKGKALPSIIFDSLGTKRIVSLAGYIVKTLNNGGVLFVDELDSGLHFKLTRAIVSLFNNIENNSTQLIFSTHDSSLLDIKTLFRKEQLWFTSKDDTQVYLYPLSDFTVQNSGLRLESNLFEYYSKGLIGALPDPSLIDILLNDKGGESYE